MRWKRWVSCCRCCGNIKERSEILNQRKSVRTPEGFTDMDHGRKFFQIQGVRKDCSGTKLGDEYMNGKNAWNTYDEDDLSKLEQLAAAPPAAENTAETEKDGENLSKL